MAIPVRRVAEAAGSIGQAIEVLEQLGQRRLAHAGAQPSCPTGLDEYQLTEREQEVLRLMARGLSNAEIAAELILGLQTVKTHVANVLAKLNARDRTQAVIRAYESGFVPLH